MKTIIMCAVFLVSQVPAFAETVMKELVNRAGGKDAVLPVEITVVAPLNKDVVLPPKTIKLSALQMERLLNLARYVHNNEPDGIRKGLIVKHRFEIVGDKLADGSFRLNAVKLKRNILDIEYEVFTLYPDGTVDNEVGSFNDYGSGKFSLNKNMVDILMKEVSLWVDYETKGGRYLPNATDAVPVGNDFWGWNDTSERLRLAPH